MPYGSLAGGDMAGNERHRVPAIVLGRGPTALGMLRCLQMAGIPCMVAAPAADLVAHSRWYRPTPGPRPWQGELGEEGWRALRDMPVDQAVIIPGADDAALWLTALPDDLATRFPTSNSLAVTQAMLQDKSRFATLASELDLPHPRTYVINVEADLDQVPGVRQTGQLAGVQRYHRRQGILGGHPCPAA